MIETLDFMSNIMGSSHSTENKDYIATLGGTSCNITYSNHPKFNNISADDSLISFSYVIPDTQKALSSYDESVFYEPQMTEGGKCSQLQSYSTDNRDPFNPSIKDIVSDNLNSGVETVSNELGAIKEGFVNYFSSNDKKTATYNDLPSNYHGFYEGYQGNILFKSVFNFSKFNPSTIQETNSGFLVTTSNKEKSVNISLYIPLCNIAPSELEGNPVIEKRKEFKIDTVSFHVEKDNKVKFKKALKHIISVCGGKGDLF